VDASKGKDFLMQQELEARGGCPPVEIDRCVYAEVYEIVQAVWVWKQKVCVLVQCPHAEVKQRKASNRRLLILISGFPVVPQGKLGARCACFALRAPEK